MGSSLDMIKTLLIPAFISLSIYLLFSYLFLPFLRRHRQRYANYLPISRISAQTLPIQERIADALMHFFLPTASWRRRLFRGMSAYIPRFMRRRSSVSSAVDYDDDDDDDDDDGGEDDDDDEYVGSEDGEDRSGARAGSRLERGREIEEGENMMPFNRQVSASRREALEASRRGSGGTYDRQARLSRELEEVFMDDSDDDSFLGDSR